MKPRKRKFSSSWLAAHLRYLIGGLLSMLVLLTMAAACTRSNSSPLGPTTAAASVSGSSSARLQVVATTTIVGDVVRQVSGDLIDLTVLLPAGVDPHSFEPTPADLARVAKADVIFVNGLGLETFLEPMLRSAGRPNVRLVAVSEGISAQQTAANQAQPTEQGKAAPGEAEGRDPHVWTDPTNVIVWVQNIARTLSELDPANAATYQANATRYQQQLSDLDQWIREQVEQIPAAQRRLVTDHALFGYFARRYGFQQVGVLVPGYSTAAEPSAQELATLEDAIRAYGVKAVFVGKTVNPTLARRVAENTGTQLVFLYTGSLSPADGEAGTYLDYMRYNVTAIVNALRQQSTGATQ